MQSSGGLPHEFFSKINIAENFKGCVYKDYYRDYTYSGSFTKIENTLSTSCLLLLNSIFCDKILFGRFSKIISDGLNCDDIII